MFADDTNESISETRGFAHEARATGIAAGWVLRQSVLLGFEERRSDCRNVEVTLAQGAAATSGGYLAIAHASDGASQRDAVVQLHWCSSTNDRLCKLDQSHVQGCVRLECLAACA